jgi:transposase
MHGGRERRRRYTLAFKRQVVEETFSGDESISVVARRYDLNTNLLFNWRRRYQAGELPVVAEERALLPIRVATAVDERPEPKRTDCGAELEVVLAQGHRVRIRGAVDPTVLRAALEVLSR